MSHDFPVKHVAIIMDGNGRWAKERGHPRVWGHVRGSQVVSDIVQAADDMGVEALTLYAFSSENWSRPLREIKTLFKLLKKFLMREYNRIINNRICFEVIGDTSELPEETRALIRDLEEKTKDFEGLKLTFAFGYGGRDEIVQAANRFHRENPDRNLTVDDLDAYLFRPEIGDVDLLIRTGGDQRISNFLLWQITYAELFFTPSKWPEFEPKEFQNILFKVASRERRFGSVQACESLDQSQTLAKGHKEKLNPTKSNKSSGLGQLGIH